MKKVLLSLLLLLLANVGIAQPPQKFNYQGIARDLDGVPIANAGVWLLFTIHDANATGPEVYQEKQVAHTNEFGIFTTAIGEGDVVLGSFSGISWASGEKYLEIEMDFTGTGSYNYAGVSQLLSVPYALYAASGPGSGGGGTVSSVTAGAGLTGGTITSSGTISMPNVGTAGTYGTANKIPVFTTDAQGRVISVTNTTISAGTVTSVTAGSGLSGGTITGTGTISMPAVGTAGTYGSGTQIPVITTDAQGRVTSITNTPITAGGSGTVTSVTAGTGLTGGTITTSGTIGLPPVGTAGTYGSPTQVPVFTTDAQGRITGVTNTTIAGLSGTGWNITGNAGINPLTNFMGTTDLNPLKFRVNNLWAGELNPATNNTSFGVKAGQSATTGYSNVAIGTNALYTSTSGKNLVAIGDSALYSQSGGLGGNVAIGSKALFANTSGSENTANGYQSLYSNTIGGSNTSTGAFSLYSNTTGYRNTANGNQSLYSNTTGGSNTSTGAYSLYSNTSGNRNTSTGSYSLYSNTTGSNNTANGHRSMERNTTGISNTANGEASLANNTTGHYNTAFGAVSLYLNTTGERNTANGYQSLYANTIGNDNTAEGDKSLTDNTTGERNTANGAQSLAANTTGNSNAGYGDHSLASNTTGNYNTGLGAESDPGVATLSNWTAIGYNTGGAYSTSNSVELGNTSVATIRAQVTGITAISDARIKDNVKANVPGLDFIIRLRPVTYNLNIHRQNELVYKNKQNANKDWDGKYDVEKITMSGFIAQEVDKAAKDAGYDFSGVEQPSTPDGLYGVRYTDFIMPLVKSVQELDAENREQKKTIAEMQKQMTILMKRIQELENKK